MTFTCRLRRHCKDCHFFFSFFGAGGSGGRETSRSLFFLMFWFTGAQLPLTSPHKFLPYHTHTRYFNYLIIILFQESVAFFPLIIVITRVVVEMFCKRGIYKVKIRVRRWVSKGSWDFWVMQTFIIIKLYGDKLLSSSCFFFPCPFPRIKLKASKTLAACICFYLALELWLTVIPHFRVAVLLWLQMSQTIYLIKTLICI